MSRTVIRWLACGVGVLLAAIPLLAHHNITAKFDPAKTRTLNGVVTRLDWANPHVHILMDVVEGNTVKNWAVELESTIDLERSGWDLNTLKPGDAVTVQGMLARDGSPQIWGDSVVLTASKKRVLDVSEAAKAALLPVPTCLLVRLRAGRTGNRASVRRPARRATGDDPAPRSLMETGANVEANAHGLLNNIADVSKVAPFQTWARDLFEYRQRNLLKDDPVFHFCIPPGAVRQFQQPYGVQFMEDKTFGRIFLLEGGGNHIWHFIYTDGRPQTGELRETTTTRCTTAMPEARGMAIPSSSIPNVHRQVLVFQWRVTAYRLLHLVERFTRTDYNTLKYEVTIDDPGAYTRPWTATWNLQWVPEDLPTYYCQDNRP